jgi:hypothetical protein
MGNCSPRHFDRRFKKSQRKVLKPWLLLSYQWTMLTVKVSMFHLQCIILSETFCDKNAEAAENGHIFNALSVIHSRVLRGVNQAIEIKAGVCAISAL